MSKVWLVTGSSRGFGRELVEAVLERGDRVAATARDPRSLAALTAAHGEAVLPLPLDVLDARSVTEAVQRAHARFGRLDVVVNNAGYILHGAVEELSEPDLRDQLETNLFGPLRVVRAALPVLRRQGSGHLVQISSLGGIAAYPTLGAYHASKWALEGISESLAGEVAQFGIKVTIVEPGAMSTGFGAGAVRSPRLPEYDGLRSALAGGDTARDLDDPATAARALLSIIDAPDPPLRVVLGELPHRAVKQLYADRLRTWADGAEPPVGAPADHR